MLLGDDDDDDDDGSFIWEMCAAALARMDCLPVVRWPFARCLTCVKVKKKIIISLLFICRAENPIRKKK